MTDRAAERAAFREELAQEWLAGREGATREEAEAHADVLLAALDRRAAHPDLPTTVVSALGLGTELDTGRWVDQSGELEPGFAFVLWHDQAEYPNVVLSRALGDSSWRLRSVDDDLPGGPVRVSADDLDAAARIIRWCEGREHG